MNTGYKDVCKELLHFIDVYLMREELFMIYEGKENIRLQRRWHHNTVRWKGQAKDDLPVVVSKPPKWRTVYTHSHSVAVWLIKHFDICLNFVDLTADGQDSCEMTCKHSLFAQFYICVYSLSMGAEKPFNSNLSSAVQIILELNFQ